MVSAPSLSEKWMSLGRPLDGNAQFLVRHWGSSVISVSTMSNNNIIGQSLDGNGKSVTMAHGLTLLEGSWVRVAMASALLLLRSGVMATSITLLKRRREGGHGLCLLLPGKWMSLCRSLDGNEQGVTMAHSLPLLEGSWEGGHDLCPSLPEKWRSVVMATPIPLLEGRRARGYGLCPLSF